MAIPNILLQGKIQGYLLVKEAQVLETKNGSPYLSAILTSGEHDIKTRMWDYKGSVFNPGDCLKITGEIGLYQGQPQLILYNVEKVEDFDTTIFLPSLPIEKINDYKSELSSLISNLNYKYRYFIETIMGYEYVSGETIKDVFCKSPAAKSHHHAYIGGLLEHSLSVVNKASALAKSSKSPIDVELLITGALLHDIGKLMAYDYSKPPIDLSARGRLIDHIPLGLMLLENICNASDAGKELSEREYLHIQHLIISHHGKAEWGSYITPKTMEAEILHLADYLDSIDFKYGNAIKETPSDQEFSEWVKGLNKNIWCGNR